MYYQNTGDLTKEEGGIMEWEVVKVEQTSGNTIPFVSIGRGQLEFNAESCKLVNDNGEYKYAQLLTASEKGKTVVGVKFLKEYEENSIIIRRKVINGKQVAGMTIRNKGTIEKLFGKDGSNKGMVRHSVELVSENILKIID